jgi:hypothetical protein
VVTNKHLYRLTAALKPSRDPVPLDKIAGFAISQGEDQACVIYMHMDSSDWVITFRGNACCAEFVSLVAKAASRE